MSDHERIERPMKMQLERYMTLDRLFMMLDTGKMAFSDPDSWPDKNDRAIVEAYRQKRHHCYVRILCFTEQDESALLWDSYANGSQGCRIKFNVTNLIAQLENINGIIGKNVEYIRDKDILNEESIAKVPFIKKLPYQLEQEYRVVWSGNSAEAPVISVDDILNTIWLSPKMSKPHAAEVKKYLSSFKTRYPTLQSVNKSAVLEDRKFFRYFNRAWPVVTE
jgi:hypothetical protein